jgi:two-component system NtrC family sensor kinase
VILPGAAMLVILRTANLLGNRIRESDEKREAILAEVEHTSKLASIGRLAAGVAHEINNPLAIISAKASLMKELLGLSEEFGHKEKFNSLIDRMQDAVHRCKVITHRLLSFARRMEVTLESIVINEVVEEVVSFLDKETLYRGIKFEMRLNDDLPVIKSDRGQLQQILLNIVNNAIDASEKGGKIALATTLKDEDTIGVVITDNGSGIPPEVLKHIFEPFFTTKNTREHKGTGLGLSITYGLVKKLGGEIFVESTVGIGTTFIVDLPVGSKQDLETETGNNKSAPG